MHADVARDPSAPPSRSGAGSLSERRYSTILTTILGAGLVIRVAFIYLSAHHEHGLYDAFYYRFSAVALSRGHGFVAIALFGGGRPDASHAPLTTIVLTPIAWLFGSRDLPMRFTMTLIGLAAIVTIAAIARRVAGPRAALIAAGVAAVYPNLWVNDGLIMSEALSALTIALTILLTYRLLQRPTVARAAALGVACGAAILTRAEVVLILPLVVAPAILLRRGIPSIARAGLLVVTVAVTLAVVAPWVTYNFTRFDKPVFISTGDGEALLGSNCDRTYHGRELGAWDLSCSVAGATGGDASTDDAHRRTLAFRYMRDHKGRLPVVMAARVGREWSIFRPLQTLRGTIGEGRPFPVSVAGLAMFYVLVPTAVAGAVVLRRRDVALIPLVGQAVMVTVTAAFVRGEIRFRVPMEVAIVVLTAVAIDVAVSRATSGRPAPRDASESAVSPV